MKPIACYSARAELCDRWCLSVCLSVGLSRIIHERVNRCRPNVVGMGKEWPCRSCYSLVLIRMRMWIYDHFLLPVTLRDIRYIVTRQRAPPHFSQTLQRPWRSLRSSSTSSCGCCHAMLCKRGLCLNSASNQDSHFHCCFLSRVSILTRDIDIANLSVCPSVCLSVTFRYQMKTA